VKVDWILRSVRQQAAANRRIVVLSMLAFCVLALVAGAARLGVRTVARWGAFVGQNVHVIVYLSDDADPETVQGLAELLRRIPTVLDVRNVEPAEALARVRAISASLGGDAKNLDGLEAGYFPRSIEVHLAPVADLSGRAADLANRLRGVPGVAEVDAMTAGLARLAAWVNLGRRLGLGLLVAAAFFSVAILVAVFVRSRAAGRARSMVLLQLGETHAGVRLPAGLWMAAAALTGGGVSAVALSVGWRPMLGRIEHSLGIAVSTPLPSFNRIEILAGLAVVCLLGLGLGYFATPLPKVEEHA
jgi:cell division protein FtsX